MSHAHRVLNLTGVISWLRSWELDPTAWVIRGMRRVRLAWNVVEIMPERQREKLA